MTSLTRPVFRGNGVHTRCGVSGTRRRRTGLSFRRALLGTKTRMGATLAGIRTTGRGDMCCTTRVRSLRATMRDARTLVVGDSAGCLRILATRRKLLNTRVTRLNGGFDRVRTIVRLCRTLNNKCARWSMSTLCGWETASRGQGSPFVLKW